MFKNHPNRAGALFSRTPVCPATFSIGSTHTYFGASGKQRAVYNAGWRDIAAFSHCVLKPLEWSGLISIHDSEEAGRSAHVGCTTPLWRLVLKQSTDDMLAGAPRH